MIRIGVPVLHGLFSARLGPPAVSSLANCVSRLLGIPGCGDENFGVPLASMGILVIYVGPGHCGVVILQLYIVPQCLLVLAQLCWNGLALCTSRKTSCEGRSFCKFVERQYCIL